MDERKDRCREIQENIAFNRQIAAHRFSNCSMFMHVCLMHQTVPVFLNQAKGILDWTRLRALSDDKLNVA